MLLYILKINILSAIAIIIALCISRLVMLKYSVRWRYWFWLVLTFFILFPIRFPVASSLFDIDLRLPPQVTEGNNISMDSDEFIIGQQSEVSILSSSISESQSKKASGFSTGTIPLDNLQLLIILIWITGILVFALRCVIQYIYFARNLILSRIESFPPSVQEIYNRVCWQLRIRKPPILFQQPYIKSPLLTGLLCPVLYIPKEEYSPTELELIFLHELNHFKHKDLLYKLFLSIPRIVYWFNPMLTIMLREANMDLEALCDSNVMKAIRHPEKKRAYGFLLLRTATEYRSVYQISAGLNDGSTQFKNRIHYMTHFTSRKNTVSVCLVLVGILFLSNQLIGCSTSTLSEAPANNSSPTASVSVSTHMEYETEFYKFVVPEIWLNNVKIEMTDDLYGEDLVISWQDHRLAMIKIEKTENIVAGDIGQSMVWHSDDINGYTLTLWATNYAYLIPESEKNAYASPAELTQLSNAEKEQLITLSTGNMNLQEARTACMSEDTAGQTILKTSDFYTKNVTPCIHITKHTEKQ